MPELYVSVSGCIRYEPNYRDLDSGKKLVDFVIQSVASQDDLRVTIWDNGGGLPEVSQGDFIYANGKLDVYEGGKNGPVKNVTAYGFHILPNQASAGSSGPPQRKVNADLL
jgi:hypothetical protein